MSSEKLPDGLYDLLIDRELMASVGPLHAAGVAQLRVATKTERQGRLVNALALALADVLDECELSVE